MDDTNPATINLKWNHRGTYHRFEIPREAGCSTLMKHEDGDTVIISSDEELLHAASLPQNQQLLRLFTIENTTDETKSFGKTNSKSNQHFSQEVEKNGEWSNAFHRDNASTEAQAGSRCFFMMAQEQLLNTQKLFHKSIRSSSSGSQLSIKARSSASVNSSDKVKSDKPEKAVINTKGNAKTKIAGTPPNIKAMISIAKRKIIGNKSKKLLHSNNNEMIQSTHTNEELSDQTQGRNEHESVKSISSDSDIEIIEKSDDNSAKEHGDWTLINCSTTLQDTHLN
uniref:Uncharacterized protein n=1 Tax=Syphacia muris TaxID=451379 RepID=A0A0N5AE62_9BILA